jgi:hypothetical protein
VGLWFEDGGVARSGLDDETGVPGKGDFVTASDPTAVKSGGRTIESDAGGYLG